MEQPRLKTPDFTPPAIASLLIALAGDLYIILGLDLPPQTTGAISGAITTLTVLAFLLHDAHLRGKRAMADALRASAPKQTESFIAPD